MPQPNKWDFLRNRAIWVLVVLLVPSFIVFFHSALRPPRGPGGSAGTIFGERISWDTFQERTGWIRMKLSEQLTQLPPEVLNPLVEQQAWRDLLLLAEAKRRKLRIEDQAVATFIQEIPAFQDGGRFRLDFYRGYLQGKGLSPSLFEGFVRKDLLIQQLTDEVKAEAAVTDEDARAAYRDAHERLRATLLLFEPASYASSVTVTEEEARAAYDAKPEGTRVPKAITAEYLETSQAELFMREQPTDEEVKAFYEEHEDAFTGEGGAVKPLEEARSQAREQLILSRVRKRLTALALDFEEDLRTKRTFEEIAASHGLTPHPVGPIPVPADPPPPGVDPALLKALEGLEEGQMSEVIETASGVYLARVTGKTPSRIPPFEEAKPKVRERLIAERARAAAKQAAEAARAKLTEARNRGLRFEEVLLVTGLGPGRPVAFGRKEPIEPLGSVPEITQTAFNVALDGLTDVLETPKGFAILHAEERESADEQQFIKEEPRLREELLTRKKTEHLQQWVKELEARAKAQRFAMGETGGN